MGFLHFRFVAVYLALLNVGVTLYFGHIRGRSGCDVSAQSSQARFLISGVWVALVLLFAIVSDSIVLWDFEPWILLRWSAAMPAVAAILLTCWALRSRLGLDPAGQFVAEGPYRWCGYPLDAAWVVIFLSGAALGSNWVIIAISLVAMLAIRTQVPRELNEVRMGLIGDRYRAYCDRAGCFLPAMATVDESQYNVPNRFGLTAILGLLTVLAFIFGVLRHYESPPAVYFFVVSEIVAICLVQILFGSSPRGASAVTGAILLPFWVFMTLNAGYLGMLYHVALFAFLVPFGALVGYCIGTFAAGFFLLMDMFEPWLTGEAKPYPISTLEPSRETDLY
jgi:protein-S-isoprenylcysteine O-methyltransferase Ste14